MSSTTTTCPEPGCSGVVDDEGYCNVTGMKVSTLVATPSTPAPQGRSVPSLALSAGSASMGASSNGSRPSGGTGVTHLRTGPGLGLGLVTIPPLEVVDPSTAVLDDPHIPEASRFCVCGEEVGRSRDGRPGRTEGFCRSCGHPYSFNPKLVAGDRVGGQYEVVGALAHGGLGWVYLARDRNVADKWVVLKGILNTGDDEAVEVVIAELRFLAEVSHPSIVQVINFVEHDGSPYIVMEYVAGTSLRQVLKQRRTTNGGAPDPLPVSHAISFVLEALSALSYLHTRGLVYCDFKPDNLMQTGDSVKLIDLGAVQRIGVEATASYGTPGFQAPEIAEHGPSIASDVFTVGRTLAILCAHFSGSTSTYEHTLPPASDVPVFERYPSLYQLLLRATASSPADRFQSARDMADQLAGVLREVVALDEGISSSTVSGRFTAELRTSLAEPDWRTLPVPLVDVDDPAAGFLAAIAGDTDDLLELLSRAPERTIEVELRIARTLLDDDRIIDAENVLDDLPPSQASDWRVAWYRGLCALAQHHAEAAVTSFSAVYWLFPGELAPKLALGVACERDGDLLGAERWYGVVTRTDPSLTSAVFGLSRCLSARGDRAGAVTALDRVPARSSARVDAQVAKVVAMLSGDPAELLVTHVVDAGRVVDELPLKGEARHRLVAQVLEAAIEVVPGAGGGAPPRVFDIELTDDGVRRGLESTYRALAGYAADAEERIALVDRANLVRPRSLT